MARNALKDTLMLHLVMLARQCAVEEDAPRMRKVHNALQERCTNLGASYEKVLQELAVPRAPAAVSSDQGPSASPPDLRPLQRQGPSSSAG